MGYGRVRELKCVFAFFFSSRRRHTRYIGDWSSDVVLFRSGFRVAAIDGPVQRVQRIEQEMRIDLRLQGLQLRLRDQVLHLAAAELLDMLGDSGSQARQYCEVFAEIAPSAVARAEQEIGGVAPRESHGQYRLHPSGDSVVRGTEYCYGSGERRTGRGTLRRQAAARGMQKTGDGLRGQAQVFGFGVYSMREVLQFADCLIRVGAQENGAGQQWLGAIVYPDEQCQQQACGYEDHSGIKGVLEMLGENPRLQYAYGREYCGGRQRSVHDKAQKRVHEQKAVVLKQYEQGQWESRVMEGGFLGPS